MACLCHADDYSQLVDESMRRDVQRRRSNEKRKGDNATGRFLLLAWHD